MIVSDSSPLIYVAALADFELLRLLFTSITIPRAVYDEVVTNGSGYPVAAEVSKAVDDWIHVRAITGGIPREIGATRKLQPGEAEAITLACELDAGAILMDEKDGIAVAMALGLTVIRTPLSTGGRKRRD